jgi:hypothetical protein
MRAEGSWVASEGGAIEGGGAGFAGARDLERAAAGLAERLPPAFGVFARLAFNYRWAWSLEGPALFRAIDAHRFQVCG